MAKRMSRTLAAEIADRTMTVVNPANRGLTLNAALQRHGFATVTALTLRDTSAPITPLLPISPLPPFFLRPHQITKPVMGNEAHTRLAQNMRILPGKPRIAPVWIS